jgi:predicted MFS family arabinose efflux permease
LATNLGSRFDKLTIAAGISNLGDGFMGAAFPLLVASITRDPLLVAGATMVGRLPWLVFALLSGALVDRLDRKLVMVITDSLRAVGVTLLAVGVLSGDIGLVAIYVIAFGLGVAETFFDTSAEAIVPRLVETDQLPTANSRLQALEFVGGALAGPPLGAFLFAVAVSLPFFVDGISFALAAVFIALIPGTYRSERTVERSIGKDIGEGLRWLWGQRILRTLVLMAGVTNLLFFGILATFVLFAQDILGVGDVGYGLLLSIVGLGGLLGALTAPRIVQTIGPGSTIRLVVGSSAVLTLVFGSLSDAWLAGVVVFLWAFLTTGWNVVSVTLRQTLTPDELRGRVSGSARLMAWGTQPLGALLGGVLASTLSLRAPYYVAALGFAATLAITWSIISNRTLEAAQSGIED